jgi:hypothetical protein
MGMEGASLAYVKVVYELLNAILVQCRVVSIELGLPLSLLRGFQ